MVQYGSCAMFSSKRIPVLYNKYNTCLKCITRNITKKEIPQTNLEMLLSSSLNFASVKLRNVACCVYEFSSDIINYHIKHGAGV